MTPNYLPLDSTTHRQHGWVRSSGYRFAAQDAMVPLLLTEAGHALAAFPLAFCSADDGGFRLVALQGLTAGCNVYLDANGRWLAPYIPSHYRAYPFSLLQVQADGKILYMLGFDHSSGLYRETPNVQVNEQRFYDDAGNLLPWMQQLSNFLLETAKERAVTQQAVNALAAAKVLVPWDGIALPGLHRLSLEALGRLPANVLELLRDARALELAYAQLLSIPRLALLQQLHTQWQAQAPQAIANSSDAPSANPLTPNQLEDLLKFDWMK